MDYPHDLPKENYATHIGIFLEWYLRNSFASDELKEDSKQEIDRVITGSMTGAEFLLEYFNGKLCDDNLSKTGQDFALTIIPQRRNLPIRLAVIWGIMM